MFPQPMKHSQFRRPTTTKLPVFHMPADLFFDSSSLHINCPFPNLLKFDVENLGELGPSHHVLIIVTPSIPSKQSVLNLSRA
jgi:hypothetical protein